MITGSETSIEFAHIVGLHVSAIEIEEYQISSQLHVSSPALRSLDLANRIGRWESVRESLPNKKKKRSVNGSEVAGQHRDRAALSV